MPIIGFDSLCNDRAKIIVSQDKGQTRKHIAHNHSSAKVSHYRVDGVIIKQGNKCDYLLLNNDKRTAYFIELKGSDLVWAAKQIEATQQILQKDLEAYSKEYRIVASRCKTQEIESAEFKKYRFKWKKKLKYKAECLEENI